MGRTGNSIHAWQIVGRLIAATAIAALLVACALQPTAFQVASRLDSVEESVIELIDGRECRIVYLEQIGNSMDYVLSDLADLAHLAGPVSSLRESLGTLVVIYGGRTGDPTARPAASSGDW